MNDTPALAGFHAPLPATLAVPSALAVDVSAGFLDRVADADTNAPTARNLRKLIPGPTLLHTVESRQTLRYAAHLDRVHAALDFGSPYAGYSVDQAATIDDITARFGGDHLSDPDVIAVADKYKVPRLVIGGRGPAGPDATDPANPNYDKVMALFTREGIKPNSSRTRLAVLHGAAESVLVRREDQVRYYGHHNGRQLYARALWYLDVPDGLCPGDKRKRARHAAAAGRIMSQLLAHLAARAGLTLDEIAGQFPRGNVAAARLGKELMAAKSYLTIVISHGQVPEGTETEMLVAEVATRAQLAVAECLPAELPAPRRAEAELAEAGPAGAIGSAVISEEQAAADELDRARESVLGSLRRKLEASPDATDKDLRQCGQNKYRKLVDMGALIAEVRGQ